LFALILFAWLVENILNIDVISVTEVDFWSTAVCLDFEEALVDIGDVCEGKCLLVTFFIKGNV
jgi:hypothetical protein